MALERRIVSLTAQAQGSAQRPIRFIEALEQREQITLPQIGLRKALGGAARREQLHQLRDQFLLPAALAQRFAHSLLLQQHIGDQVRTLCLRQAGQPFAYPVERIQRIRELTQRDGAIRGTATVVNRRAPFFREPEMMREHVRLLVDELRIPAFDGAAHSCHAARAAGVRAGCRRSPRA